MDIYERHRIPILAVHICESAELSSDIFESTVIKGTVHVALYKLSALAGINRYLYVHYHDNGFTEVFYLAEALRLDCLRGIVS